MNAKMKNQIQKPYVRGETILRPIDKLNLALLTEPMMSKRLERRLALVQLLLTKLMMIKKLETFVLILTKSAISERPERKTSNLHETKWMIQAVGNLQDISVLISDHQEVKGTILIA